MIQTKSSETLTAVRVIIDAASEKVDGGAGVLKSGAATSAVTTVAATTSAMRIALRIDASRRAAQKKNENRVDHDEKRCEDDRAERAELLVDRGDCCACGVGTRSHGDREERRDSRRSAKRQRNRQHSERAADHQRPRAVRSAFPRRERQRIDVHRLGLDLRIERAVNVAAFRALLQMRRVRFRIFGIALTGVFHNGSTNDWSSVLSRFRARNSLFLTVPRGSLFIEAISSYDSSAKWRSWINSR